MTVSYVSQSLGRTVKRLRAARGLPASELARAAGISRATLVEIEAGRANPTIETLRMLATELGVPLVELLADADGTRFDVVRADEGQTNAAAIFRSRLVHRLQLNGLLVEVWDMHLAPGRFEAKGHPHGVSEHLFVREGRVRIGSADGEADLGPEDFVSFQADRPHWYETDNGARLLGYVTYPTPASSARSLSDRLPRFPGDVPGN